MKLRLAWLADAEDADSYSARETRVLLPAIARRPGVVPLWFALNSAEPPHFWNGIRVFPLPSESLKTTDFLRTLIEQQRPDIMFSNLSRSAFPAAFSGLPANCVKRIYRLDPIDAQKRTLPNSALVVIGTEKPGAISDQVVCIPYLKGLDSALPNGDEPTIVLHQLWQVILDAAGRKHRLDIKGEKSKPVPDLFSPADTCLEQCLDLWRFGGWWYRMAAEVGEFFEIQPGLPGRHRTECSFVGFAGRHTASEPLSGKLYCDPAG
jgi:hypothetical protein